MVQFMIFIFIIFVVLILRIFYMILKVLTSECNFSTQEPTLRTILCIGSGGHTTELLRLLETLNTHKYQPRLYILAMNDTSSEFKIHNLEKSATNYALSRIQRSRNVRQKFFSSIFSTLHSIVHTVPVIYKFKPNLILCNGPGTCIPVCFVSFLFRCFFLLDCRIVFIESLCRVRTLSLSGKILQYFADVFIVQWPELRDVCFRAKYFGRLT